MTEIEEQLEPLPSEIPEVVEAISVEELSEETAIEFYFAKPEEQEAVIEEYPTETFTYEEKSLKQLQKEQLKPEKEPEVKKSSKENQEKGQET